MITKEDFLPDDLPKAIEHYKCCKTCLKLAETELELGQLNRAEMRLIDFNRSLAELKRLRERKIQQDRISAMICDLIGKGIDIKKIIFLGGH
ncbi:hypothetical protein [Heyndrickxia coagulans]|uniref:hypothetical protein n=1 Tax=Heyndrickxia coagulans TaxID=1398 RepID=UPI0006286C67|nr:hypothetical protein [Heyndrickxia coagulans]